MAEKIANTGQTAGPVVVGREDDIHIDPTSASHSIYVTGFPATTKSEDLIIHFQRKKNGGGDIDSITISKPGAVVITFDSPEVVQSVLQQKQEFEGVVLTVEPYVESTQKDDQNFEVFELVSAELCLETVEFLTQEQTSTLLKEIAGKTGIVWFQSSENFMMSGTFKQVEVTRIYLQQAINQSGGIAVFSGLRRKNVPESQKREENEFHLGDEENEAEVKNIEAEYHVEIPREAKGTQVKLHRFVPDDPQELEVFGRVKARVNFGRFQLSSQDSRNALKVLKDKMEVEYHDVSSKECVLYGTFNQIEAAHKLLQDIFHGDTVQTQDNSSETVFEVQPPFMKLLKRVYKTKLQEIEEEFCVKIVWSDNTSQVQIRPSKTSSNSQSYQKGCDAFIDLYQDVYPNMDREAVELKRADDETLILEAISSVEAENDVVIEKAGNKLLVYAEKTEITRSVQALKEKLGLAQGNNRKTRRGQRNLGAREYNETPQEDRFSLKQPLSNGMSFSLYQSDITDERVDAIVNAANNRLQHGGGVAAAIVRKGGRQIEDESRRIMSDRNRRSLDVGDAVHTSGGHLPCRFVIHTVGPVWKEREGKKCVLLLRRACIESLRLAAQLELCSIALPAISSGIFGMPKKICAQVMFDAVEEFSSSREAELSTLRDVRIVTIDDETISFFREEFVKRYTSQYTSSSPTNLTALERPSGEKQESSPILNSSVKQPSISSADTVVNPSNFSEIHVAKSPYGRGRGLLSANLSRRPNGEVVSKASGSTQLLTKGETKNTEARRGRDITYATTNTPPGLTVTKGKERQDSKQIEECSDANNNWRQVQSDVGQMRQTLDKEKCVRNIRKQELREKETVLINTLQHTLCEEQQVRTRVEEELIQARIACNELEVRSGNELAQMRQTLNNEIRLRNNREQELREKGESIDELQKTLLVEQQARTRVGEELTQARSACTVLERRWQDERQVKENAIREQRRLLEEERQQKSDLEDRLRTLRLQMEQERNRYEQDEMLSRQSLQQELQVNENAIREQRRLLEEERQQKTDLEDRLRTLQLQMEEERNRYASTERELQSAVSAAQEALIEYQRHQPRDWIIQREEVALSGNFLGKGAWGNVREGTFRCCQVAVKEIHELILSDHNRRLFEREMSIASCCRHPNLLQFIGATNDDGSPLFVTELLDTSLRHILSQRALNHDEIVSLALDVTKGLNYLHLNKPLPIIHRDISSANVLLWRRDECWRAKLSDYGAANFMRQVMTTNPGAIIYSAPEAFTSQQSPKVDVYSFGLLLCEMCVRELPVPQMVRTQIGQVTDGALRRLIQRCVERDPGKRPTMSEVISELEQLAKTKRV